MINEKYFWELQRILSAEFSKYALSHPEIDDRIPDNAQVVFHLKDNADFNAWSERVAFSQKEADQPVIIVEIDDLAPPLESRLVNPHIERVSK